MRLWPFIAVALTIFACGDEGVPWYAVPNSETTVDRCNCKCTCVNDLCSGRYQQICRECAKDVDAPNCTTVCSRFVCNGTKIRVGGAEESCGGIKETEGLCVATEDPDAAARTR